ncbi:MAG: hypothetical protein AAB478_02765 [Patescibacteria group bacterium]
MIITKAEPYSKKEIENLKEQFDSYIKTVIDIDFNSFINIRPTDNNAGNEILDPEIRKRYDALTRFFFQEIL